MIDSDKMPFGPYKGVTMGLVPGRYLIKLWKAGKLYGGVADYVRINEVLLYRKERNEPFCAQPTNAAKAAKANTTTIGRRAKY